MIYEGKENIVEIFFRQINYLRLFGKYLKGLEGMNSNNICYVYFVISASKSLWVGTLAKFVFTILFSVIGH